jgi:hypothetical protein
VATLECGLAPRLLAFLAADRAPPLAAVQAERAKLGEQRRAFLARHELHLTGDRAERARLVGAFLKAPVIGPWASEAPPRFKLAHVGRSGSRAVTVVNRRFDLHADAARLRDNAPLVEAETQQAFRPLKMVPHLEMVGFSTMAALKTVATSYQGVISRRGLSLFFDGADRLRHRRLEIPFDRIEFVFNREYGLDPPAVEIFTTNYKSYLFLLRSGRKPLWDLLRALHPPVRPRAKFDFFAGCRSACGGVCQTLSGGELLARMRLPELWASWRITNYEYLFYLNVLAGRSFNSLERYPVFPWLLRDATSPVIDLCEPAMYRDLSVVAPALSPVRLERAADYLEASAGMGECAEWPLLYTSGGYVMHYLIRVEPFTTAHIALQSGKFDRADRLFNSLPACVSDLYSAQSYIEAIPELFCLADAFTNTNRFDLGVRQISGPVGDVSLPAWARSPSHFVAVHRVALESAHVSDHLNEWIDLVFGRSRRTIDRHTLFLPYAYPEYEASDDNAMLRARAWQADIGLVPLALFAAEHPRRGPQLPNAHPEAVAFSGVPIRIRKQVVLTNEYLIDCRSNRRPETAVRPTPDLGALWAVSHAYGLAIFGTGLDLFAIVLDLASGKVAFASHENALALCAAVAGSELLITGGSDGALRFWRLPEVALIAVAASHCSPVIAVAACLDNGLVASVDRDRKLVFQLVRGNIVRCVAVEHEGVVAPMVLVYKSGTVVAVVGKERGRSQLMTFDAKGEILLTKKIHGKVSEVDKCCGVDTREFLIIGKGETKINVYDVGTLDLIARMKVEGERPLFSRVKGGLAIWSVQGGELKTLPFDAAVETVVHAIGSK